MKTPPLLLGMTLLFWGWQTGLLYFAAAMALLVEGSRLTPTRWELSELDFRRIWTLCTLLFLGATIHAFVANDGASGIASLFESQTMASRSESLNRTSHSVLTLLQYLPLIFFPMVIAQVFSQKNVVDLRALSWLLRRRLQRDWVAPPTVNLYYPYLSVCLLAASTTNTRALVFYIGLCVLLAWALWSQRNRRFSPVVWAILLVLVGGIGFAGHSGLNQLQKILQNLDTAWLSRFARHEVDARGNRTFLGEVGRLKMSGKILLRVTPISQPPPALLREATYNLFTTPLWYSARKEFKGLIVDNDESTWRITSSASTQSVRIARYLKKGQGILPVPTGTWQLEDLPVFILTSNAMGVLRVETGPAFVHYRSLYSSKPSLDGPPEADDQDIPDAERPALLSVANNLGLEGKTPEQILKTVDDFFRNQFSYSTLIEAPGIKSRASPLSDFLLSTRSGHCEFFATATVLLLRQAGIPTRYAVGYSVQERKGEGYIVRERHAHSWCLAYINGAWRDFDTTPPSWHAAEAKNASFWEPVKDWWSAVWFRFSEWRYGKTNLRKYSLWLVIPPLCVVVVRLFYRRRWGRHATGSQAPEEFGIIPGKDSEFYLVTEKIAQLGFDRGAGEPLGVWISRLQQSSDSSLADISPLLALHYRYRFDPLGLAPAERAVLRSTADSWLKQRRVNGATSARV